MNKVESVLYGHLQMKKKAFGVRVCWVSSWSNEEAGPTGNGKGEPTGASRGPGHLDPWDKLPFCLSSVGAVGGFEWSSDKIQIRL